MEKLGKSKICLIIPSLQAGGMERVMSELAWYFSTKKDVELHLVLYGINRTIFFPIPESARVYRPDFKFDNRYRTICTIRTLFYLRNTVKKIKPHRILSFGEYWNNFVLLSLLRLKFPVYVSDRSQPDKSLGQLHDRLRKWLYPSAQGLIFQTQKAREIFLRKHRHPNIAVIGNPIRQTDSGKTEELREKLVLMVGRFIKSKHQDLLIKMFARVSPPDWKLVLVGYDHLKQSNMENLKALARNLDMENQIQFTGKKGDLEELYLRSSIFAFTSSSEGFPNAIGEAMAAALPVVAFDCVAGPSEMISDGHDGFLIPLFDEKAFEAKLAQLISDETLRERMGNNARESIKKSSHDLIGEAFYRFINDL
ncbi:MAG: glycosyltransferase [Bacteroidales bacterium]|nr:glycosyltransferase [Bacteroidales bacterium]